jgi:hypothetical protein
VIGECCSGECKEGYIAYSLEKKLQNLIHTNLLVFGFSHCSNQFVFRHFFFFLFASINPVKPSTSAISGLPVLEASLRFRPTVDCLLQDKRSERVVTIIPCRKLRCLSHTLKEKKRK